MLIASSSTSKAIDPGMLDNLVAGGIASGATVRSTLVKEAREEAGITPDITAMSRFAGHVSIFRAQPDELQRETVFGHDLWLAQGFSHNNQYGEAVEHRLVGIDEAALLISRRDGTDVITGDASLVFLDFLLRRSWVPPEAPEY